LQCSIAQNFWLPWVAGGNSSLSLPAQDGGMQGFWVAALVLIAMAGPVRAEPVVATGAPQGLLCRAAVAAAERANGIPAHLLAAISRVESGRPDPLTGNLHPWPWTANAEGQGYYYDTKAQAVAAVRDLQTHGVQSIDVGCGQVNLMHHPNAFPSLDVAFDPQANASYAGKFLKELFDQTGDWTRAVGMYHSATPNIGNDYRKKVLAAWPEEVRMPNAVSRSPLARAWGATIAAPVGRSLGAYRAMPVRLAMQASPTRIGK
jgi:soluble lytic murein transglycosylase-like protein